MGQRGLGSVLPTPLWYRRGNRPGEGRGLAQAHTARSWGSSPRVLGHSPTLLRCRDPEGNLRPPRLKLFNPDGVGWQSRTGQNRKTLFKCIWGGAEYQAYSIHSISQVTLGPRESLLVVAPGTGWGPSGGGEAEDEGWRGEEGGLGRCA